LHGNCLTKIQRLKNKISSNSLTGLKELLYLNEV